MFQRQILQWENCEKENYINEAFQTVPSFTQKCECEKISVLLWKNINL